MLTLSNKLQPQMSKSHRRSSSSGGHARHVGRNNPHPLDNSIDHLFLLPERALSMSASRLQKDLAGLDFDARLLHEAPMGNVWLSGSRPSSVTKEERENRARSVRERQHEERQRKLEEIKVQAFAAQRFKEQKEMERRHRLDELRNKEDSRRAQVEERKRAINEAERDRLESILKRNQEREARLEAKKRNERSSMVFAFGSSTPRMLDDIGPYCGPRRATSTQNIMSASVMSTSIAAGVPSYGTAMVGSTDPAPGGGLTRRQSERELDATGKKRATSAGGLERTGDTGNLMSMSMYEMSPGVGSPTLSSGGASIPTGGALYTNYRYHGITRSYSAHFGNGQQQVTTPATPAGCVSGYVGRRRTDLVPTIPLKDTSSLLGSPSPSRLNNSANGTKSRSSPGRAYSMSRLDQLATPRKRHVALPASLVLAFPQPLALSQLHTSRSSGGRVASGGDMSRSMSHLAASTAAGANNKANTPARPLRKADSRSMHHLSNGQAPLPPPRMTRATQLRQQMQKVVPHSNAISSVTQNEAASRPGSAMSHQSTTSIASSTMGFSTTVHMRNRPLTAPVRKPRPTSIAVTGITSATALADKIAVNGNAAAAAGTKPPLPKSRRHTAVLNRSQDRIKKINKTNQQQNPIASPTEPLKQQEEPLILISQPELAVCDMNSSGLVGDDSKQNDDLAPDITQFQSDDLLISISESNMLDTTTLEIDVAAPKSAEQAATVAEDVDHLGLLEDLNSDTIDMTASMMSKVRINTEEEAKAALAEKRRIAREEAEKQAEQERQRHEEEIRAEQERQQREEEQQRVLIEEMKAAEQKRLEEAIRQKQFEEEEERHRLMEETRQKALKEEAERRAKEEAERQKLELEERMRNEEKEREQRRKRVEAIMLRTRGKNTSNTSPPQSEEKSEKLNGSNPDVAENGHKNGKNMQTVDNIIPVDTLKNANIIETLSTDDALNSNNAWQMNTPTDLLM